jgi:hypothetical protein
VSTASTLAAREAPREKNTGPQAAKEIGRSTRRAIEEAAIVGGGSNLRHAMTAEAAYYLAERRGFRPGHELEDWVAAEGEIQRLWTRALEEAPIRSGD